MRNPFSSSKARVPGRDKELAEIRKSLDRIEKALGGYGVAGTLNRLETGMTSALRGIYFEPPEDLPPPERWLVRRFRGTSQNEEDGLILAILADVGVETSRFIEIGCGWNGGNCGFLARELGWAGLMVDAEDARVESIRRNFPARVAARQSWITREGIDDVIREAGLEGEVDVMSIDIDGNDIWVWEAVTAANPRLQIIEFNPLFGPERAVADPYDKKFARKGFYYGASIAAMAAMGRRKGYRLVAIEPRGVNAFFLRNDIAPEIPELDPAQGFRMLDKYERRIRDGKLDLYGTIAKKKLPLEELT